MDSSPVWPSKRRRRGGKAHEIVRKSYARPPRRDARRRQVRRLAIVDLSQYVLSPPCIAKCGDRIVGILFGRRAGVEPSPSFGVKSGIARVEFCYAFDGGRFDAGDAGPALRGAGAARDESRFGRESKRIAPPLARERRRRSATWLSMRTIQSQRSLKCRTRIL